LVADVGLWTWLADKRPRGEHRRESSLFCRQLERFHESRFHLVKGVDEKAVGTEVSPGVLEKLRESQPLGITVWNREVFSAHRQALGKVDNLGEVAVFAQREAMMQLHEAALEGKHGQVGGDENIARNAELSGDEQRLGAEEVYNERGERPGGGADAADKCTEVRD
jgi:hypothetical protein